MEILVCMKQVPDDSVEISMNPSTGKPALESVTEVVNAFDTYALEMATRLKEEKGGHICVLSLGGKNARNGLKNCLAVGADEAFLILDENYQEKNTVSVAEEITKGIQTLETQRGKKFDIIFCGKESTDFASGQVGIMIADLLAYGVATNLIDLQVADDKVSPKRETETGYQILETSIPCVVTVSKPHYDPRYPTIKSKMAARKKEIEEIAITINEARIPEESKLLSPSKRQAGITLAGDSAEELVAKAMEKMMEAKVF